MSENLTQIRLEAAIRLIQALKDPDLDTMKARSDHGMWSAKEELEEAEKHAKLVGLEY